MNHKWIDIYIDGLIEHCNSKDILDMYNTFDININKLDRDSFILQGNESIYIRNYFGIELVFIRNDLPCKYKQFILAHELGHALLHTELKQASYSKSIVNKGKLERQADYFALKLLDIHIDPIQFKGLSMEQIARALQIPEKCLKLL